MYMLHNQVLRSAFSIYLEISCLGSMYCVSSGFTSVWDTCLTAWTQPSCTVPSFCGLLWLLSVDMELLLTSDSHVWLVLGPVRIMVG